MSGEIQRSLPCSLPCPFLESVTLADGRVTQRFFPGRHDDEPCYFPSPFFTLGGSTRGGEEGRRGYFWNWRCPLAMITRLGRHLVLKGSRRTQFQTVESAFSFHPLISSFKAHLLSESVRSRAKASHPSVHWRWTML